MVCLTEKENFGICPSCEARVIYEDHELGRIDSNYLGLICPKCGGNIRLKKIKIFHYPDDFGSMNSSAPMSDDWINENIKVLIKEYQKDFKNKNICNNLYITSCGNTIIFVYPESQDQEVFSVIVTKNYDMATYSVSDIV